METREVREGYTIVASTDGQNKGFVVQEGDSYLVDGDLIYHLDYDGGAYPSIEIARAAILAYQRDTDPAVGPSYPADQWPGYGKGHSFRHFRIVPWDARETGEPKSQWPTRTLAAVDRRN